MRVAVAITIFLIVIPSAAGALTLEELKRYDENGDGALDDKEMEIYRAHVDDPILAKYDANTNGRLDADEYKVLKADIERRYAGAKQPPRKPVTDSKKLFEIGKEMSAARR